MLQSLPESSLFFARGAVRQPMFSLPPQGPKRLSLQTYSIVLPVRLYHTLSSGNHINTDSAAPSVREVLLSAGTGIVTRCERWLEKRSSRPPPNSILKDIVLDAVDMILWVGKSATRPADVLHHLRDHLLKEREELLWRMGLCA